MLERRIRYVKTSEMRLQGETHFPLLTTENVRETIALA